MRSLVLVPKRLNERLAQRWLLAHGADACFVAFPKSGSTWMRFFVAEYFSRLYKRSGVVDFDKGWRNPYPEAPRLMITHIGNVPGHQAKLIPVLDKSSAIEKAARLLTQQSILFLARDPRDVVVSYYFHLRMHHTDTSMSAFIRDPNAGLPFIIDYMNIWYGRRGQFAAFELFRYEDFKANPTQEFRRMLARLSVPVYEETLVEAIEASDFSELKRRQERGEPHKILATGSPDDPDSRMVRRGRVGGFIDYFTEEDRAYAATQVRRLHEDFGYTPYA